MKWWQEILPIFSEDKFVNVSYQNKTQNMEVLSYSTSAKNIMFYWFVKENQEYFLIISFLIIQ